jgi:hypothetical protein
MGTKWMDEGENDILNVYLGTRAKNSYLYLRLYTAPTSEPAENISLSNLTEVSGSGYTPIQLSPSSWVISGDLATYPQQTVEAQSPNSNWGNVYGYYIATSSDNSGKLVAINHFASPYNIQNPGDQIRITLYIRAL